MQIQIVEAVAGALKGSRYSPKQIQRITAYIEKIYGHAQRITVIVFFKKAAEQRKCFEVVMCLLEKHFANLIAITLRTVCEKLAMDYESIQMESAGLFEAVDPSVGQARLSWVRV
ncbi:MAG: hypothetical protein AAB767_03530 [Patescibacteria group bacterium]